MKKYNKNIYNFAVKNEADRLKGYASSCNGPVFKGIKITYIVFFIYNLLMIMANAFGSFAYMDEYRFQENADQIKLYSENTSLFYLMLISIALNICVIELFKLQKKFAFLLIGLAVNVIDFVTLLGRILKRYNELLIDSTIDFWWKFGIALIILTVLNVIIFAYWFARDRRVKQEYDSLTDSIYKKATSDGNVSLTDDEFEELLNNYGGGKIVTDGPMKRSVKRRIEKSNK